MEAYILSALAAGVILCTVMAMYGFQGRVNTIGVDLGTTYSAVGFKVRGSVTMVEDSAGRKIFPSVVAYFAQGELVSSSTSSSVIPGLRTVVGYDALPYLRSRPQSTVYNAKRFIGRRVGEPETDTYAASHPFSVIPIGPDVSNHSAAGFDVIPGGRGLQVPSAVVPPEAVGADVLRHLLDVTAKFLGHDRVSKAVIAVPAKFTDAQRAATGEAFKRAGLKVVRVLEEPTAAAVAYDLHKKPHVHHILVYDFGGGTLDVSMLYVAKESVQVYATDGDDMLGGSDFDICLGQHISHHIASVVGTVALDHAEHRFKRVARPPKSSSSSSRSMEPEAATRPRLADVTVTLQEQTNNDAGSSHPLGSCSDESYIRNRAELIKRGLSFAPHRETFMCHTSVPVVPGTAAPESGPAVQEVAIGPSGPVSRQDVLVHDFIIRPHAEDADADVVVLDASSAQTQENVNVVLSFDVTKEQFETVACGHLFDRSMAPVQRLLDQLEMQPGDVDEIVLVGGSTRIPRVKEQLRSYFNKDVNDEIDPDLTVAYGAASILD